MKKILILIFTLAAFNQNISFADEGKCEQIKEGSAISEQMVRRGCCSWHQGVCSCSNGRVVCCDGSYSPSCTCNEDNEEQFHFDNKLELPKT
jgi:hypothetical protein